MPLTLIARILAVTAALSGTTRGEAGASTGLGRSSSGGAGVTVGELGLDGAGVLGGLAGAVDALSPCWAPTTYRFSRGSAATAPAITVITRPIAAMTARTTIAICLGPKGSAHLLHARLKPADRR
jgi:hypothetical protein